MSRTRSDVRPIEKDGTWIIDGTAYNVDDVETFIRYLGELQFAGLFVSYAVKEKALILAYCNVEPRPDRPSRTRSQVEEQPMTDAEWYADHANDFAKTLDQKIRDSRAAGRKLPLPQGNFPLRDVPKIVDYSGSEWKKIEDESAEAFDEENMETWLGVEVVPAGLPASSCVALALSLLMR
ncbi:hypothetical protein LTR09_011024 [Extremus antarcticus]|uniref:Uncharacterized protein n=1 Tax=Extremus antarcticus TaxID=702011 RepID=A0AAJ0D6V2_9PEZI|nr:hypothetical protein LTR09_011024 [Extremus antarcticus]